MTAPARILPQTSVSTSHDHWVASLPVPGEPPDRPDEDDELDEALEETFPASDPPSVTRREEREEPE